MSSTGPIDSDRTTQNVPPTAGRPQRIGSYRLLELLGEGGMGVVYLAEQEEPLHRRVALKLIKLGLDTREVIARFESERQALALMNHPGIARVLDAGATPEGRPYFVMEYVPGVSITEYCDRNRLKTSERLVLFDRVCAAIQHAHQKGIIHRDLKPSNVLVAVEDGEAIPKVIDFGVAKAINQRLTEKTLFTQQGILIGTPAYMSPEQAEMRGHDVDATTDIYSLGVLLYELLVGTLPFETERLRRAGYDEIRRILREEEFPLPSARISTLGDAAEELARRRRADVPSLVKQLRGDLDWIIFKAIEKDRTHRYPSAIEFARDIRCYLNDEPVSATPPSAAYRLHKLVRKHRAMIAAVGAVAAALLLGLALSTIITGWFGRSGPGPPALPLTRLTSDSGLSYMPALSPDGRLLAYASDRSGEGNLDIWVKPVAGGEPVRLTWHTAPDLEPAFSPDGTRIAFRSERDGRGIYVVSALGSDERRVVERGYQPQWSRDGQWISYAVNTPFSNLIYAVPSAGGAPKQLVPEMASARPPVWSADGKQILFMGSRDLHEWDWWVAPFEGGQAVRTGAGAVIRRHKLDTTLSYPLGIGSAGWPAAWSERNQVLFCAALGDSSVNIWGLSLSPRTWEATGAPQQITSGSGSELGPSVSVGGPSGERLLAFANVVSNTDVWSLPVDHTQGKSTGELERLTRDAAEEVFPSTSADGKRVVFLTRRPGSSAVVWLKDLASGREAPIITGLYTGTKAIVARDGSKVAYRDGYLPGIQLVAIGTGGHPIMQRQVCESCGTPTDWSVDGSQVLWTVEGSQRGSVALLDVASGKSVELLRSEHTLLNARLSPDGCWIVVAESFGTAGGRLWIAPLKHPTSVPQEEWILVSEGPDVDSQACWAPDGNLVYMVSKRDAFRCIWAQRLEPSTKSPRDAPFPVRHFHGAISMTPIPDSIEIGLNAAGDRLFFSLVESSGNIWLARIGTR